MSIDHYYPESVQRVFKMFSRWRMGRAGMLLVGVWLALASGVTHAQTDIFIRGAGRLIPIAVPQLCVEDGASLEAGREVPQVIGRNLDLSGFFEVLDPGAYIETPGRCGGPEQVVYSDWSVIRTEGLVRGVISPTRNGVRVQLYLHDVPKQQVVLGKEYEGDLSQVRQMAHRFSNEIMRFFTGAPGPFGSQVVFSSRVGRFKELFIMDMDGSNIRQLTNERALAVSPSFDRSGSRVLYTSYRNRVPDIFLLSLPDRRTTQITRGAALEVGPQFAPFGEEIAFSRSSERDSDIVIAGVDGTILRTLTRSGGTINVSPSWSPDGAQLAFCSNRAGGPQIYTMQRDGSNVRRVSFVNSGYCTSPAWSPDGSRIAFVCRADRGFQVFVANPDGSQPLQLTSVGDNEDPSWSPDSRYLVISSTFGKGPVPSLAMVRADGINLRQLTQSRAGDHEPAWGPVIN